VVGGVEGAFDVCAHDVDVFVVDFCTLHHHDDGGKGVVYAALMAESICWSLRMPWVYAYLEHASLISAVRSLSELFMRAMGRLLSRRVGSHFL
jgi:hypothetical protein